MLHNNIEFHNTSELVAHKNGGLHIRRIPLGIREKLSQSGRTVADESAGCEVRFITDAENFRLDLSCLPSTLAPYEIHNSDAFIFKGSFLHSHIQLKPGVINHININDISGGEKRSFGKLKEEVKDNEYFSHNVWRVMFGRYPAIFHGLETYGYPVRAPLTKELPKNRIMFYGSSITNGASPTLYHLCYVQMTARLLGADALNFGLSGSCLGEPAMAQYLSSRNDWNSFCIELGVNMRMEYTLEEFKSRSHHLVDQVISNHPDKNIFLITIYPNAQSPHCAIESCEVQKKQEGFSSVLREYVRSRHHPNLYIIEGKDILRNFSGMSKDLIHPSDYGHIDMGYQLANKLSILLGYKNRI